MATDRFYIGPINTGLETDVKSLYLPEDAFATLYNAYVFRGRVKKRFGSHVMNTSVAKVYQQFHTRLRILIGTTDNNGDTAAPITVPGGIYAIGQAFTVGTDNSFVFTVNETGSPGDMLSWQGIATGTYDTVTGAVEITGALPNASIYFYPSLPVMGLLTYEIGDTNNNPVIAFDRRFSYEYISGAWLALDIANAAAQWSGTDSDFFWDATIRNINADLTVTPYFFVVNFREADGIRYYDGTVWHKYLPWTAQYAASPNGYDIITARIVLQFHGRLLFLNTLEHVNGVVTAFPNRCRFSWVGNILVEDPVGQLSAFRTDQEGKGGTISIQTSESIISAEFIKDRLIVFCERSTWELVYTGNQIYPFEWQKLDTTLGAEASFSTVPFDKTIYTVGNVGVHACNGMNIERIDQKIPDFVYQIHNNNQGIQRIYGVRDYYAEMVYWTFADEDSDIYPNQVLVYNYRNNSWALNDDTITCFGYWQQSTALLWQDVTWQWKDWGGPWNSGAALSQQLKIIAGNQEGFIFVIDIDTYRNAPSLQVTDWLANVIYIVNSNVNQGDWLCLEGLTDSQYTLVQVLSIDYSDPTIDLLTITFDIGGPYRGGATAAKVSIIDILTKQYGFYLKQDRNTHINKVNFLVDKTDTGEILVDYMVSASSESELQQGSATSTLQGTGILETHPYPSLDPLALPNTPFYPLEKSQDRLWHLSYIQADGATIQLRLYWSDEEIAASVAADEPWDIVHQKFELHGIVFFAQPSSANLY